MASSSKPETKEWAAAAACTVPRWISPPAGSMKINVGIALSKASTSGAVVAVGRDENTLL